MRIKGIVQTSNPAIDDMALFVSLHQSRQITGLDEQESTEVALRVREGVTLEILKQKLKTLFPFFEIYTWKELYPALEQMQVMMDVFNGIV